MIKAYSKFLDILEKIQRVILTVSVPAMVLIMSAKSMREDL